MRILRAASYRRMPWKNGGGETIEMVISPDGATFETFDLRLSMAHVGAPGPFSIFRGIDRTLSVIEGNSLVLTLTGPATVTLDRQSAPFAFPGDVPIDSTLVDGPIDDLNVMTRRGRCVHRVARYNLVASANLTRSCEIGIIVPIGGEVDIALASQTVTLGSKDALLLETHDATTFVATPKETADLFVVEIAFG